MDYSFLFQQKSLMDRFMIELFQGYLKMEAFLDLYHPISGS